MSNKKSKSSKKIYLLGICFVMLTNTCLIIFLIQNIFAQTSDDKIKDQSPIVAEVVKQNDNPLLITIINVDNSNSEYQSVNYSVQNIGNKSIRGYVIFGQNKGTGRLNTKVLPINPFQTSAITEGELIIERDNIKSDKNFYLSVDYVRFVDGSSYGEDSQQQSEYIVGGLYGSESAVEQSINFIRTNEVATFMSMIEKPLVDIEVYLPDESKTKSEKWQNGFNNGYKSIFGFLKSLNKKGEKNYLEKLTEIQKTLKR